MLSPTAGIFLFFLFFNLGMLLLLALVSVVYLDTARARKARQDAYEKEVPITKELLALFANPQLSRQAQALGLRPLSFGQDIKRTQLPLPSRARAACLSMQGRGAKAVKGCAGLQGFPCVLPLSSLPTLSAPLPPVAPKHRSSSSNGHPRDRHRAGGDAR